MKPTPSKKRSGAVGRDRQPIGQVPPDEGSAPRENLVQREIAGDYKYVGAAWRSRFLGAPKIALLLAERQDFVPVAALGIARLGLKTGADDFFFVKRKVNESGRTLVARAGVVQVEGMESWRGEISKRDLKVAILNPHELFADDGRLFSVPTETNHFYLSPTGGHLKADLRRYIELGEIAGVQSRPLVSSNASESAWFRQVRSSIRSPWMLPYNSAYDYGAWDNSGGAVLNGRFVGVDPLPGVQSDLLGAALNSTFAVLGRLVEGVSTGVESAFDAGPPAVKRVRVPDVRRLSPAAVKDIERIVSEMRRDNRMPPAPQSDGSVHSLRRQLDETLLCGLGATRGEAASLLDSVYASYARWRRSREQLEVQAQQNRRQMSSSGQGRSMRPSEVIGRTVWEELRADFPAIPGSLLLSDENMELVSIPSDCEIPPNEPMIEPGVLTGKRRMRVDLGSYERVRYVGLLRDIGVSGKMAVPFDGVKAGQIANIFEECRARFTREASKRISGYVSDKATRAEALSVALGKWMAVCRASVVSAGGESTTRTQ